MPFLLKVGKMRVFRFLAAVILMFPANLYAEDSNEGLLPRLNIEAAGAFDMFSEYIWRGFALDTDPVLQPGLELSGYGVTFSFWSSWDFDNDDSLDGDEIDYVLDYTYEFDDFSVSIGHTYYEFPGTDTFSREFYVSIGIASAPLSPAFTYYYDYGDEGQGGACGQYAALEISHSLILEEELGISLDLGGRIGYNKELFINGQGGDILLNAGLTIPLNKGLTFSPSVNYAIPYGDLDDTNDGNQRDRFYYGFSTAYSF